MEKSCESTRSATKPRNSDGDTKVTILFDGAGERTLLLSLAHDKLEPEA